MLTVFTDQVIGTLYDQMEIVGDTKAVWYGKNFKNIGRVEVSGIGIDADRGQLDLLSSIYKNQIPPQRLRASELDTARKQGINFAKLALSGQLLDLVDIGHEDLRKKIVAIHDSRDLIDRVNLFVISDQMEPREYKLPVGEQIEGRDLSMQIWGITDLLKARDGSGDLPVDIDLMKEFSTSIPCVTLPNSGAEYDAYVAVLPAQILHWAYDKYRVRLLEDNVRHFLQSKGKVNRQIMESIKKEPDRFFAYNNGITTVATGIEFAGNSRGRNMIRAIKGWKIVNGGQTTASIHSAGLMDEAALKQVSIPVKIIVLKDPVDPAFTGYISRYSNSQNKVVDSDFAANDPYFKELETLSRGIWVKSPNDAQLATRWYFERVRGQYQEARLAARKEARGLQARFDKHNPRNQRFDKLELARSENAWECKPHIVSQGAEKNFDFFIKTFDMQDPEQLSDSRFRNLLSRLILFRGTNEIVKQKLDRDYRANIVAYSVACLADVSGSRLRLEPIYKSQSLPDRLGRRIGELVGRVDSAIMEGADDAGFRNIGEWCKRQGCWDYVRKNVADFALPENMLNPDQGSQVAVLQIEPEKPQVTADDWKRIAALARSISDVRTTDVAFILQMPNRARRGLVDTRIEERLKKVLSQILGVARKDQSADQNLVDLIISIEKDT